MAKPSITHIAPRTEQVLELLSSLIVRRGHSMSWYRSKKGRTWVTLKGYEPVIYTTSVEYDGPDSSTAAVNSMVVLLFKHWPKVIEKEPPLNTWLVGKSVGDELESALSWLAAMPSKVSPFTGEVSDG